MISRSSFNVLNKISPALLGLGGGASVASAIQSALDASQGDAFWLPTDMASTFNGASDGAAVTSLVSTNGITLTASGATRDATSNGINFSGSSAGAAFSIDAGLGADMTMFAVLETTDDVAILISEANTDANFGFIFQDGSSSTTVASTQTSSRMGVNLEVFVDQTDLTGSTRDVMQTNIATGSKIVLTLKHLKLDPLTGAINLFQRNNDFNFAGLACDILLVDTPTDAQVSAIENELAGRHGIFF